MENRPWSEIIYEKHRDWIDKDGAARMLEETKSLVFAQKCAALGDIPVNRAEQTIKASPDWYDHVVKIVESKTVANIAKADLELARTKKDEFFNDEANHRAEARL